MIYKLLFVWPVGTAPDYNRQKIERKRTSNSISNLRLAISYDWGRRYKYQWEYHCQSES